MRNCEVCGQERVEDYMLIKDGSYFCNAQCYSAFYTAMNVKGADVEFQTNETHLQWKYVSDTIWIDLCPLTEFGVLTKGDKGDTGEQGLQGLPGADGINGTDGQDGYTPIKGIDYFDGEQGIQGVQGLPGAKGDTGDQGLQGLQGLQGIQGDIGNQGIQGEQGLQGIQGIKGDAGNQGIQGEQGLQGLKGDTGDTGLQGLQGIKGDTGLQGDQGIQGVKGDTGNQGIQGVQGIKGDTGNQGIQGLKGDQGDQGLQGIQGIQGIQGLPGSDANVTKANVEAVLTGVISSHSHAVQLSVPIISDAAAVTWTNMPVAVTFWNASHRHITKVDLTNYTQVRLVVNKQTTAGAAASKLILRYRTAFSITVGDYSDIGSTEVSVAVNTTNTVLTSSWINLAVGAKADIFLSLVGSGGDGILDPAFGQIFAQFR